jgi:hypothetical protein
MNDRELTREPTVDGARRTQLSACDEERSRQIGALTSGLMPGRRGGESCAVEPRRQPADAIWRRYAPRPFHDRFEADVGPM